MSADPIQLSGAESLTPERVGSRRVFGAVRVRRFATHRVPMRSGLRTPSFPSTILLVSLLVSPFGTAAQETLRDGPGGEPPLTLPRIQGEIELDGRPDEPAWESAVVIEGVMHLPDFGAEPSERTEFLMAHDGQYIYFACRAYDSEPDQIRITTLERDVSTYNTDACGIRLDSYNDEENALLFNVTPASVRTDWSFANDATGGPPNMDWDTFWDAEGTLTEYGWSGEMRLPFSSLGFQLEDGRVVMGFALARSVVRRNETTVHPAIPPNWGPSSIAKPSQMRKMIITGVEAGRPVYLTPYALGGGGHAHALDDAETRWVRDTERVIEVGGDLRYGVTRNLNLDLTVNTDFAQVEADAEQVNLTRFSLFFPEQRRFFQERAAIFEFPLSFQERLFHSRRIGLVAGEPVRIYGGGRLVGRVGDWDVGLLDMQTAALEAPVTGATLAPSENMGVLRLRRRVLNQFSYLGGILTSRIGSDGSYNVLYGTDAVVRVFGQDYLTVNWAQSFVDDYARLDPDPLDDDDVGALDRGLVRLNWQRRGTDGLTYGLDATRAGELFEPGLGFLRRTDYLGTNGSVGYGWRPGAGSALNAYSMGASGNRFERNEDGSVQSASYGVDASLETRGGHAFSADATRSYEDLARPFTLSESAFVPAGSYWFNEVGLQYNPPAGGLFRPSFNLSGGEFYDGSRISGSFSPAWSASRHLRLSGTYEINRIRFDERDQDFTSHLVRFRTEVTLTTRTSASAFVQYNSTGDLISTNFRFRYNPREGTDLYIVWNEGMNSDRDRLRPGPELPLSQDRTILVKYAHTFTLGF